MTTVTKEGSPVVLIENQPMIKRSLQECLSVVGKSLSEFRGRLVVSSVVPIIGRAVDFPVARLTYIERELRTSGMLFIPGTGEGNFYDIDSALALTALVWTALRISEEQLGHGQPGDVNDVDLAKRTRMMVLWENGDIAGKIKDPNDPHGFVPARLLNISDVRQRASKYGSKSIKGEEPVKEGPQGNPMTWGKEDLERILSDLPNDRLNTVTFTKIPEPLAIFVMRISMRAKGLDFYYDPDPERDTMLAYELMQATQHCIKMFEELVFQGAEGNLYNLLRYAQIVAQRRSNEVVSAQ